MKFLVILALVGCAAAQSSNKFAGKYVYDLLKPALNAAEVQTILASRGANSYPTYNGIPQTNFQCSSKAQPGFYADVDTQCQVFHRCEQSGNQTDYLCVNGTIFNQITLICDAWYNVDCSRSIELEDFANSRLYTNLPLFDTPPADYIAPSQQVILNSGAAVSQVAQPRQPSRAAPRPAAGGRNQAARVQASGAAASASSAGSNSNSGSAAGRADNTNSQNADQGSVQVTSVDQQQTAGDQQQADQSVGASA